MFLYDVGTVHLEDVSKTISPGDTILRRMEVQSGVDIANVLVKIAGIFHTLPSIEENKVAESSSLRRAPMEKSRGISREGKSGYRRA